LPSDAAQEEPIETQTTDEKDISEDEVALESPYFIDMDIDEVDTNESLELYP
jgi:hypothetical protein